MTEEYWKIAKNTSINLEMKAKFPIFNEIPENVSNFATVGFVLDWSGDDSSTENTNPIMPDVWDITFTTDGNGFLLDSNSAEQTTMSFKADDNTTIIYPAVKPCDGYLFDGWYNADTDTEITDTTVGFTEDTNIEARFVLGVEESDASWFVCNSDGQLQGFSDVYEALDPKPVDIVIPKVVDGYTVTDVANTAFQNQTHLKTVIMPNTITSMQNACFASCSNLEKVTLSNNLSSVGQALFNYCTSLDNVVIPNSLTSLGDAMFMNCSSLETIEWHDDITNIGQAAFQGCEVLATVELPKNIKTIGSSAFCGCNSVTEWILPSGLETIGGNAFNGTGYTTALTRVFVPNTVTSFGATAFLNHPNLTSIELEDGLTSIGSSAFTSSGITTINIPSSMTTIGESAFSSCMSLEIIYIDKPKGSIAGYEMMWGAPVSTTVIVWNDWEPSLLDISEGGYVLGYSNYYDYIDGVITDMEIPAKYEGITVTQVNESAFAGDTDIQTVTVENGIQMINVSAFKNCTNLMEVYLPNSINFLGTSAFEGCTSLDNITIPSGLQFLNTQLFKGCTALTEVNIPSSVSSIAGDTFDGCTQDYLIINIDAAEDSIDGAPWGATNATINWLG